MTIKAFTLISGVEIISEISQETETSYFTKNPAIMALQENEDGGMGIMIAAFQPYADGLSELHKCSISATCVPVEALAEEYKSRFEEPSLIQVPGSKKLIV